MLIYLAAFYVCWSSCRGAERAVRDAVMRRRHANLVLCVMYAAAAGTQLPNVSLLSEMKPRLPWLPGYDRRDALSVAMLLEYFEPDSASADKKTASLDALVLSSFWNCRCRPSPGDNPAALSLREWLLQAGMKLHRFGVVGSQLDNLLQMEHSAELEDALPAGWIDKAPVTSASAAAAASQSQAELMESSSSMNSASS